LESFSIEAFCLRSTFCARAGHPNRARAHATAGSS
jgi:hypothetical protein